MKKAYITPEIDIISFESDELMDSTGLDLSSIFDDQQHVDWGNDNWN